jgi:2-amino-4-hydroxy-6-hydroxymethyldihydropteridine diphosphokinase
MIILGLGSNLGDREHNLAQALRLLSEKYGVRIAQISSLYETAPFGVTDQPDFLNMTAIVNTELLPQELLDACLSAEQDMGRVRILKWGPRVIDIDVLIYNGVTMYTDHLILPHPGILERLFVLIPLREITPDLVLANGLTPTELIERDFSTGVDVKLWKTIHWNSQMLCFV